MGLSRLYKFEFCLVYIFTGEIRDYDANENSGESVLCTVSSESSMFA